MNHRIPRPLALASGVTALLLGTMLNATAATAAASAQASHGSVATTTTTVEVQTFDAAGNLVSDSTTTAAPVPYGTAQSYTSTPRITPFDDGTGGSQSASGCQNIYVTNVEKTTLGFTAFKFHTSMNECWNKKAQTVTINSTDWSISDVDGQFQWKGINNSQNNTINNGKQSYKQGHFTNCVVKYGCVADLYPANTINAYYSGTYGWHTNG